MQTSHRLKVAVRQAKLLTMCRWFLRSLAFAAPLIGALWLAGWMGGVGVLVFGTASFLALLVIQVLREKESWPNFERFVGHLNRTEPELEESAELILSDPENLTPLQQLQRHKLENHLATWPISKWAPRVGWQGLGRLVGVGLAAALLFCAMKFLLPQGVGMDGVLPWSQTHRQEGEVKAVNLTWTLTLKPPAYTQRDDAVQNHPRVSVVQGTLLHWELSFDRRVSDVRVNFRPGDAQTLGNGSQFDWHSEIQQPGYYYLEYKVGGQVQHTAYFPIEVIPDVAPIITVLQPEETRTEIPEKGSGVFTLQLEVSDDYGVEGGELVVTVAKGNGENVKFREKKAALTGWDQGEKTKRSLTAQLVFQEWEAAPGDEVYFYAEMWDNRTPEPNRSRSDTFFLVLLGGDRPPELDTEGILIKPVRAYFRSQRQIIIDTEKLLAQRAEISAEAFRERSEGLGVDQKVLRLRYGQFLGEEFESEIGIAFTPPTEDSDHHSHDDHEHGDHGDEGLPESLPGHDHGDEEGFVRETLITENVQDLLPEGLLHDHDNAETATFFEPELKAQLKDALSEMWSSELYLRSIDPEASLPFQYRALKMIKDIQQMSRVYEQRAGIEMPPLEPEKKRLTGERKNMASLESTRNLGRASSAASLRQLWGYLSKGALSNANADLLNQVLPMFEEAARKQPGRYLAALEALHKLRQNPEACLDCRDQVLAVIWQLLPEEKPLPESRSAPNHSLGQTFLRQLGQAP